jgi:hypothetical protein
MTRMGRIIMDFISVIAGLTPFLNPVIAGLIRNPLKAPVIPRLTREPLKNARHCRIVIRRQAYPVNNLRIYLGVNVASLPMNAGGVTLLCICKTPKGQRHPAFAEGKERRLPPDKSGGYSQNTPTGVRGGRRAPLTPR